MKKLRNCPFCKKEVKEYYPYLHFNENMEEWIFSHNCEHTEDAFEVCITVYGKTEQEVIDKWNGGESVEVEESESL